MRLRIATLASVVAALAVLPVVSGQEETLRYRWAKGDEVRYRVSQQGSTTISGLPGMGDMTMNQLSVQVTRLTVEDVAADASATLRQTFESIRMELDSPAGKAVFDSTAPDKPTDQISSALSAMVSKMVGESITIVLLPTGAVARVEGMSRIFDKAAQAMPQDPAGMAAFGQFKESLTDNAMRGSIEQNFAVFPDRPVRNGETWTGGFQMKVPVVGTLTTTRTSTLKGVEGSTGTSIARIAVTYAMKQDADAAPAGPMGMVLRLTEGKGEGEILFDIAKGRVHTSSFRIEMPMSMSMTAPDGSQINLQSVVQSTMKMEIVEK